MVCPRKQLNYTISVIPVGHCSDTDSIIQFKYTILTSIL